MRCLVRIHLVNGSIVDGDPTDDVTQEDVNVLQEELATIMTATGGWQINTVLPNNGWACFPRDSILYVEIETVQL